MFLQDGQCPLERYRATERQRPRRGDFVCGASRSLGVGPVALFNQPSGFRNDVRELALFVGRAVKIQPSELFVEPGDRVLEHVLDEAARQNIRAFRVELAKS